MVNLLHTMYESVLSSFCRCCGQQLTRRKRFGRGANSEKTLMTHDYCFLKLCINILAL